MSTAMSDQPRAHGRFETTRWSVVLQARGPDGRAALQTLCRCYWHPIYAFICSQGVPPEKARDFTQGFFTNILERNDVATVKPEEGRFRSWLRTCARHYFLEQLARERRVKYGGGALHLDIDERGMERSFAEPRDPRLTPEKVFDRAWALAVTQRAFAMVRERYIQRGKEHLFLLLEGCIGGQDNDMTDRDIADRLEELPGNIRVYRMRLKAAFRKCLREVILETVADPRLVDAEVRELFDALS